MQKALSNKPGDSIRINSDNIQYAKTYKARIRGYAKNFPGFLFSSYKQISYLNYVCTSFEDINNLLGTMVADDLEIRQGVQQSLKSLYKDDEWKGKQFEYPREQLRILLKDTATDSERNIIANNVRSFFPD